jgi:hypothetical protein
MIVHRQLCDGILKGWNQDPAYPSPSQKLFEQLLCSSPKRNQALLSSLH